MFELMCLKLFLIVLQAVLKVPALMYIIIQTSLKLIAAIHTHGGLHWGPVPGARIMLLCPHQGNR